MDTTVPQWILDRIDLSVEHAKQKIDSETHRLMVKHDWEVLLRTNKKAIQEALDERYL